MALVILAALFSTALFVLFKLLDRHQVDARAAIVVNYAVAFALGLIVAAPVRLDGLAAVALPACIVGIAFVGIFHLLAWSTRDAGVAPTTVAAKISMIIPVLAAVLMRGDKPGEWGWTGIALALCGVVLATWPRGGEGERNSRWLPLLIFIVLGTMDAVISHIQHSRLTTANADLFSLMVFGVAGVTGLAGITSAEVRDAFRLSRTWVIGGAIGAANYGALQFLVLALAGSGRAASTVFPLVNIIVILLSAIAARALFAERTSPVQNIGIAISVIALMFILRSGA